VSVAITATPDGSADASIQRTPAGNGVEHAYRDIGQRDVRLVLLRVFTGNLDDWDPVIDELAAERPVIAFDDIGVGGTTGTTPNKLRIYPDAGHGFLFQHHREFAAEVHALLEGAD
jgi:pimeloyl-ACP methyl ester carboxylesterase